MRPASSYIEQGERQILSTDVPLQEKTFNELDFSQIKSRTADMGFFRFKNSARDSFFEGKSLAAEGKLDEAISAYTDALNLVPLYYDALMERGKARQTNKQYEEAKADFLEAVRITEAS